MKDASGPILVFLLIVVLLPIFYLDFCNLVISGAFDKDYTRAEVEANFIEHEKEFADLVTYFNSITPKDEKQEITFRLGKQDNRVRLNIYSLENTGPHVEPKKHHRNLDLNSPS